MKRIIIAMVIALLMTSAAFAGDRPLRDPFMDWQQERRLQDMEAQIQDMEAQIWRNQIKNKENEERINNLEFKMDMKEAKEKSDELHRLILGK